jgi:hypothetical protein
MELRQNDKYTIWQSFGTDIDGMSYLLTPYRYAPERFEFQIGIFCPGGILRLLRLLQYLLISPARLARQPTTTGRIENGSFIAARTLENKPRIRDWRNQELSGSRRLT